MRNRDRWPALAVLTTLAAPAAARAEDNVVYGEEPPEIYVPQLRSAPRKLIGFDFGLGMYDAFCDGCGMTGGLSAGFSAGVQLTRRLAVLGDIWSLLHLLPADAPEERGVAAHSLTTAAARIWLRPTLWLQGGAGAGWLTVAGARDDFLVGVGGSLAIGGELKHRPGSGIDLALRLGSSWFPSNDGEIGGLREEVVYNVAGAIGYHWN
jgi:hypothetical protein